MNDGRYPIIGYNSQGMPKVDDESGYDVENEFAKSDWEYPASGWSSFDNYWINAPNTVSYTHLLLANSPSSKQD